MIEVCAEAGVNHMGQLKMALRMVDAAKAAGADICKFQIFNPGKLFHRDDPNFRVMAPLALSKTDFATVAKHCERNKIEFLATPGDLDSLRFLVESLGVKRIKIGSDDLTYKILVDAAYKTGLPIILSTGMATINEIAQALPYLVINKTTLLHCVSLYPCEPADANLRAIATLRDKFRLPVGYSDHCRGTAACVAAAAMGAVMIEKHFVFDGSSGNEPDAVVSIWPKALATMITEIRLIDKMLGTGQKMPCAAELENTKSWRKGPDGRRPYKAQAA